jgi:recombination protein RecA
MGVDCDALYVFRPDFVEQAGDVLETLLYSEDCGLVVVDSLAALETSKAIREPMEKFQVAGASVMIKRMCNKVTAALRQSYKEDRPPPTVLFINQIRFKIGVMFGNPETMPGGQTPKFTSSFTVRIWGKPVKDEAISKVLPARREMQTQIRKNRIQITASIAKWEMNLIPTALYPVGECDDWKAIKGYLEHFGLALARSKTYDLMLSDGEVLEFPTQKALRERLITDQPLMDYVRETVIRHLIDAEDD